MRPLSLQSHRPATLSRIISSFDELSTSWGYVTCPLLTRLPLRHHLRLPFENISARLACVKHAASVHSEPGSNSSNICVCIESSREGRMYKGMTGIVLYVLTERHSLSDETHTYCVFHPFSSLSSFQGTNCACRSVDRHPWGEATDFHSSQIAKKVKTLRFSRRAWPSLFLPLRVEH